MLGIELNNYHWEGSNTAWKKENNFLVGDKGRALDLDFFELKKWWLSLRFGKSTTCRAGLGTITLETGGCLFVTSEFLNTEE